MNLRERKLVNALTAFHGKKSADHILQSGARAYESLLQKQEEHFWTRRGEKKAIILFHKMAERVPAYKDFLKKHRIRHGAIESIHDFRTLPMLTKENYIQTYPYRARLWDGRETGSVAAVSSGTSGNPSVWSRGTYQEAEASLVHELILTSHFKTAAHKTLFVVGFPMGAYVSGVATLLPLYNETSKWGSRATVVTPGNKKEDFLRVVGALYKNYDQLVFAGHPFFIKDVIEEGKKIRAEWTKKKIRLFLCSESFNETWREYIAQKIPRTRDAHNILSVYGSSEFLLMGSETPQTIYLKKILEKDQALRKKLGITSSMPQVFQYNPLLRYIESVRGELIITAASGIPLVRYNIHDAGLVYSEEAMRNIIQKNARRGARYGDQEGGEIKWRLPYVFLSGRSDLSLVFYAANIYPEHIHYALDRKDFLKVLTGKFFMRKKVHKGVRQTWEIYVEMGKGVPPRRALSEKLKKAITKTLLSVNHEYGDALNRFGARNLEPNIVLCEYQSGQYFKPGLKPRYLSV